MSPGYISPIRSLVRSSSRSGRDRRLLFPRGLHAGHFSIYRESSDLTTFTRGFLVLLVYEPEMGAPHAAMATNKGDRESGLSSTC